MNISKIAEEIATKHKLFDQNFVCDVAGYKVISAMVDFGNQDRWVSVEDSLPEAGKEVLVARFKTSMGGTEFLDIKVGMFTETGRCNLNGDWINVAYWQPLPNPPKKN